MEKLIWQPGTMVYPAPAVLVSCGDKPENYNIITIAWTGTICSDPAMTYVSIRPSRHSYALIKKNKEFVINLTTKRLAFATDFCGVKSGRDINKFERLKLTPLKGEKVAAPLIEESPINIECQVTEIKSLGSHDMFLAKVLCIHASKEFMNKAGKFDLRKTDPICYSHGNYYALGKCLGHFGYSIKKR
ncbi:flavin reductase [candidate division WOR-1 bacterium RIFOXYB2_FULL_42_35]|uniref:Flavin reductase n=1 Tax=candidate division WOR-1 bacterium RIFOXYC2_FULL_41_25 TaxID=1802586 RepID=A0A1F4TQE1_UNCSA|nr:MAG: flavin reductase [candidate division WOR-1 bacterium RIFOXYA2_FULL_41_14]OGC25184.1 MAG: flavin reductase [candidate division WOR-1 bacterium RIFOXYB2_FULL_42_35]OGC34740.1 MAG: flavin reductase [candidate division WOR-1 bacterium RIFOXYC2_FULL_41_25]OGC42691.1 MAG: flavin reductase [candidate division WOR-1 bacterium RIFOXYD2_FULL_41_8]